MIIPIQRESSNFTRDAPKSQTKSSSSSYTAKKSVRITPKITEVEIVYPSRTASKPSKPESIDTMTPILKPNWDDISALTVFEPKSKRWGKGGYEDFVFPTLTKRSPVKDKFDDFTSKIIKPSFMGSPIEVQTFVEEPEKYVQFKPEEMEVKVTDDIITITGKHEDRKDEQNFSSQEYSRKHTLPPGVKADDVRCKFNQNGILTITAPRKTQPSLELRERMIPIQHSGMPAIRV